MIVHHKKYHIELIDDSSYPLHSVDNSTSYNHVYPSDIDMQDRYLPSSKHGIRVSAGNEEISSAILFESGGATCIHKDAYYVGSNYLLVCCSNKMYSLSLPALNLNWRKRLDPATCFAIYPYQEDFIIHGELTISRIDKNGDLKWDFGARDIFITPSGEPSITFVGNNIKLTDWEGSQYLLDETGKELAITSPMSQRSFFLRIVDQFKRNK